MTIPTPRRAHAVCLGKYRPAEKPVVDLGPGAGFQGGEVVFEGTIDGLRGSGTLTGRHLDDATVATIATRVGRTPAQVLLRWCVQRQTIVIPKSTRRERIEENAQIFDFTLSADDMAELDALDRADGTDRALESTWW